MWGVALGFGKSKVGFGNTDGVFGAISVRRGLPLSDSVLGVHMFIYLSIYLSICISISLSINLSIYLSLYLSMSLSIYLSIYLPISLFLPFLCTVPSGQIWPARHLQGYLAHEKQSPPKILQ